MQRNSTPLAWRPKGISDTLDASESFKGSMSALANLIPDPSTPNLWQCRPASVKVADFVSAGGAFSSGFSSGFGISYAPGAGFISCFRIVGNFAYGLIDSTVNPGFDQPFCFNLVTGAYITVPGGVAGAVPASPAAVGAWTPPIMDVIGSKVIVCHPGFAATANFIGWFDISTPSAPVWHAGNLAGAITFSTVPLAVAQFNGRAYYVVNTVAQPAIVFSDPLNATQVTNASQVLTFGDSVALSALGQLRLYNATGGIVQGLLVFKQLANIFQVTGDSALSTLTVNALNVPTGTLAPNSICTTPKGLAFISPEGLRFVDFQANVSDPIGLDGQGITLPFIYSNIPSRMCADCGGNVLRVTTQNANAIGTPFQEYWFDLTRKTWSGPHSFPASLIRSYNDTFIMAPQAVQATLWQSDVMQTVTSGFTENGVALTWAWATPFLPDTDKMTNSMVSQATLDLALSASAPPINVSAVEPSGAVFDTVSIAAPGSASVWGGFVWGAAAWGSLGQALGPRQLQWHLPIVFAKMSIVASGQSAADLKIGTLHLRYKILRYLTGLGAVA